MSEAADLIAEREGALLAPYAMHSSDSAGRVHDEPPHPYRNAYQRDRDRLVHSSAFRRLAHKTQVFTGTMGDYHRSRLTHTLEVASIARTIGRTLRLNEDLIEALALAHDIGHPPFGHAGEGVLDECLTEDGGFNHNRQALRIVELLEQRYPNFPGLNLTCEVLSGQRHRAEKKQAKHAESSAGFVGSPLLEVQVTDAADSIAYDAHDPDDAVELGLLDLEELSEAQLWREAGERTRQRYTSLDAKQFRRATVHGMIDRLVSDVLATANRRLEVAAPESVAEVLAQPQLLVAASPEMVALQGELEALLFERVYRHPTVLAQRDHAAAALRAMYQNLSQAPARLPLSWLPLLRTESIERTIADYLASMTDRFALEEARQLTGL